MRLAILYTALALIAMAANIGSQELTVRAYHGPFQIPMSVIKYALDKAFIFRFRARDTLHDARTFGLYLVMGIATTAIFWGFEFGFNQVFQSKDMRYVGGLIGLAIGYWTKYHLDKRYVFRSATP